LQQEVRFAAACNKAVNAFDAARRIAGELSQLHHSSPMEDLNQTLFLLLNASAHPSIFMLGVAIFFAVYAIWAVPAVIGIGWLRGNQSTRQMLLQAVVSAVAGLLIGQIIALFWQHPRPFAMGLGHNFLAHVANTSFPSSHLTFIWSVAFSLAMHRGRRALGIALAVLGVPVAWARIYTGVHFPLDMAGAALVAVASAWLTSHAMHWFMPSVYGFAIRIHRLLFGKLIARGWVRR
jgi:undecaprenyl-diphosphatase